MTLLDRFEFDAGMRWIPLPDKHVFSWSQWAFDLYWDTHTSFMVVPETYDPAFTPTKFHVAYFALCVLGLDVGFTVVYKSTKRF